MDPHAGSIASRPGIPDGIYRVAFQHSAVGTALLDADRHIIDANAAFCEVLGLDRAELLGSPMEALVVAQDRPSLQARVAALPGGEPTAARLDLRCLRRDGREVWLQAELAMLPAQGRPPCFCCQVQDISERKRAEHELEDRVAERTRELATAYDKLLMEVSERERAQEVTRRYAEELEAANLKLEERNGALKRLARIDDLTGLFNRRQLMETLNQAFLAAHRYELKFCVLMIDLDHFKPVNDTRGHATGDRVLARVGALLRENLRASDIAGRFGGEEFCVGLPHTSLEDGLAIAEKVRQWVRSEAYEGEGGRVFHVTCSIGLVQARGYMPDLRAMLERADRALYDAKRAGRDRVVAAGD